MQGDCCIQYTSDPQHCTTGLLQCLLLTSIPGFNLPTSCRGNLMRRMRTVCGLILIPGKRWSGWSHHGTDNTTWSETLPRLDLSRNPHLIFAGSAGVVCLFDWFALVWFAFHFVLALFCFFFFFLLGHLRKGQKQRVGILWICILFRRPKLSSQNSKMVDYFTYWCYPYLSALSTSFAASRTPFREEVVWCIIFVASGASVRQLRPDLTAWNWLAGFEHSNINRLQMLIYQGCFGWESNTTALC